MTVSSIIVEDGSQVPGANSYVSAAELAQYVLDNGVTLTGDTTILIFKAMSYIESLLYKGLKYNRNQPLQWPRVNVWLNDWWFRGDRIPQELKNGVFETAIAIDQGIGILEPLPRNVSSETVGPISVTYSTSSSSRVVPLAINSALWKLLMAGGTAGRVFGVTKA